MSASHTPGPWQVQDPLGDGIGDALWIVREGVTSHVYDWRCIGIVTSDDPDDMDCSASEPISVAERDANARLIAAAPALLDALGWLESYLRDTPHHNAPAAANARAAIALAKGESA